MSTINLKTDPVSVDTTKDNVVIVNHLEGLPGGRVLDVTGFADAEIQAGHVIIRDNNDPKEYKPLPTTGTLPANHSYVGILFTSITKEKPSAAIMIRGTVNEAYVKYNVPAAAKTALATINFINE